MSYIIELDVIVVHGAILFLECVDKDVSSIIESYIEPELTERVVQELVSTYCNVSSSTDYVMEYLRFPVSPALQVFEKHYDRYITRLHKDKLLTDEQYFEENGCTYKRFGRKLMKRVKEWDDHGPIHSGEKYSDLIRALTKAAQLIMHPESTDGNLIESFMTSRPFAENFFQILSSEVEMTRTLNQARHLLHQMSTKAPQPSLLERGYTFESQFLNSYFRTAEAILLNT